MKTVFVAGGIPYQMKARSVIKDNIKSNPLMIFPGIAQYFFLLKEMFFIKKLAKKADAIIVYDKTVGSYFNNIAKSYLF